MGPYLLAAPISGGLVQVRRAGDGHGLRLAGEHRRAGDAVVLDRGPVDVDGHTGVSRLEEGGSQTLAF